MAMMIKISRDVTVKMAVETAKS